LTSGMAGKVKSAFFSQIELLRREPGKTKVVNDAKELDRLQKLIIISTLY